MRNGKKKRIVVVGGGAAGMLAALLSASVSSDGARRGERNPDTEVILLEQNEKLGKKVYITGKGRCNLTNASETTQLMNQITGNPKFLYSALYGFTSQDTMNLFEALGLRLKVERGNRVFPSSDKSSDVIRTLENELKRLGVAIHLFTKVTGLIQEEEKLTGVRAQKNGKELIFPADCVLLATGGLSYPTTGATGDGYRFAKETGHTVTACHPSLVPFETKEDFSGLMGLSLRNITLTVGRGKKQIYSGFGELLFTHFGISGPLVLQASTCVKKLYAKDGHFEEAWALIDLKPALSEEELDARVLRDFSSLKNRQLKNSMDQLLPKKLIPVVIEKAGISPEKKNHELTKAERLRLVQTMKHFPMLITGTRGYKEAVITSGGVSVKQVNPQTMESKLVPGLYFAGELLDVDAMTGGYNLQIAWSTAALAAHAMRENK